MVNCPNCGHTVPSSQRFCGNCGADAQAAPAAPQSASIAEQQPAPYAYSQPSGYDGYDASYPAETPRSGAPRLLLVVGLVVIALCCACFAGIVIGDSLPDILKLIGIGAKTTPLPKISPTATPQALLFMIRYWVG